MDIANYNWGGKWRMPTQKEVQELIENCEIQYYESKGIKLIKVTGPNGNFIIIPSAGFVNGTGGNFKMKYDDYSFYLYIGELYSDPFFSSEYSEDSQASFLFIGDRYDQGYNKVKEERISSIDRYEMLPVRAVMDK